MAKDVCSNYPEGSPMAEARDLIAGLVKRARAAQAIADTYSQERVDELIRAVSWPIVQKDISEKIAELAVAESQLGYEAAKFGKLQKKVRGALRDMLDKKTVGIIDRDPEKGIVKVGKPVGVIGALLPCTNPEATPVIKAMCSIKGRNAIILAPHPRTKKTNTMIADIMRMALKQHGAPEDLILTVDEPTMEASSELLRQCDLIVATGGAGMVKAAYSSGTPAYGVGAGNVVTVVDDTADIAKAAKNIMLGKTFDFATSCSSENSAIILEKVYDATVKALQTEGGYLVSAADKKKLQETMWENGVLSRKIVGQAPEVIASHAGIDLPAGSKFFMVQEEGWGPEHPFSGEKMSVVLTVYKAANLDDAIMKVNKITGYQGSGHSCGIHTAKPENAEKLALNTKTSRVMMNQAQCYGNSGDWINGMPFTLTLGCGTWGGNIASENIVWKHYINTTWLSMPIPEKIPDDADLYGEIAKKEDLSVYRNMPFPKLK